MPANPQVTDEATFPYIYFWNRMGRKGEPCQVTARGKMNSCCVKFADGFTAVTSRNAIRKPKPLPAAPLPQKEG